MYSMRYARFEMGCLKRLTTRFEMCSIREIDNKLKQQKQKTYLNTSEHKQGAANIKWAKANPNFWYDPSHSVVVQINASEIIETTDFPTRYSFKKPWVVRIRDDKTANDICTLTEFRTFCLVRTRLNFFSVSICQYIYC